VAGGAQVAIGGMASGKWQRGEAITIRRDLNWLQRLSAPSTVVIGTLLGVH
jgi:hypothetical protein